jgi:FkbM family methyltransferase
MPRPSKAVGGPERGFVPHVGWFEYESNDEVMRLLREGHFESLEQAFLWLFLRPGDVVVDAGAHWGLYSVLAGRAANSQCEVHAFEPAEATVPYLRRNLALNGIKNVTVVTSALWSKSRLLGFNEIAGDLSSHSHVVTGNPREATHEISAVRLSDYINSLKIETVTVAKIDTEGSEIEIINGAEDAILKGSLPVLLVEFAELNLRAMGHTTKELEELLIRLGYTLYILDAGTLELLPFTQEGPTWYSNIIAARDPGSVKSRLESASGQNRYIARDIVERGRASQKVKELEELDRYKVLAREAEGFRAWAEKTETFLATAKLEANENRKWAERSEASLNIARAESERLKGQLIEEDTRKRDAVQRIVKLERLLMEAKKGESVFKELANRNEALHDKSRQEASASEQRATLGETSLAAERALLLAGREREADIEQKLRSANEEAVKYREWAERSERLLSEARQLATTNELWAKQTEGFLAVERAEVVGLRQREVELEEKRRSANEEAVKFREWAERSERLLAETRQLATANELWAKRTESLLADERAELMAVQQREQTLEEKQRSANEEAAKHREWVERSERLLAETRQLATTNELWAKHAESLLAEERAEHGLKVAKLNESEQESARLRLVISRNEATIESLRRHERNFARQIRHAVARLVGYGTSLSEATSMHRKLVDDVVAYSRRPSRFLAWALHLKEPPLFVSDARALHLRCEESVYALESAKPDRNAPELAVVLCTYNPATHLLRKTIESLAQQSLLPEKWEFVLVDNGSLPPLDASCLTPLHGVSMQIVREPEAGLTQARVAGFRAVRAPLIVCLDDDVVIAGDYLEKALHIARTQTDLGTFGGISEAVFEVDPVDWLMPLIEHLAVRDYGQTPIVSSKQEWGRWDPIGAGMVLRKKVATEFDRVVSNLADDNQLGRSENRLLGGEDTLLNRLANRLGLACAYQPELRLKHFIKAARVSPRYMRRLLFAQGATQVRLGQILGLPMDDGLLADDRSWLRSRWRLRRETRGPLLGPVEWYWDLGFATELRRTAVAPISR